MIDHYCLIISCYYKNLFNHYCLIKQMVLIGLLLQRSFTETILNTRRHLEMLPSWPLWKKSLPGHPCFLGGLTHPAQNTVDIQFFFGRRLSSPSFWIFPWQTDLEVDNPPIQPGWPLKIVWFFASRSASRLLIWPGHHPRAPLPHLARAQRMLRYPRRSANGRPLGWSVDLSDEGPASLVFNGGHLMVNWCFNEC